MLLLLVTLGTKHGPSLDEMLGYVHQTDVIVILEIAVRFVGVEAVLGRRKRTDGQADQLYWIGGSLSAALRLH